MDSDPAKLRAIKPEMWQILVISEMFFLSRRFRLLKVSSTPESMGCTLVPSPSIVCYDCQSLSRDPVHTNCARQHGIEHARSASPPRSSLVLPETAEGPVDSFEQVCLFLRLEIHIDWISQDKQLSLGGADIDPQPMPLAVAREIEIALCLIAGYRGCVAERGYLPVPYNFRMRSL